MADSNKEFIRRMINEIWNNNNLGAINEFCASDVVNHELPEGLPPGLEGTKAFLGMFMNAFPDTKMMVEDQTAEGNKVVTRWTATGTHTDELMGIPATGKRVTVSGIDIHRLADGKIVEMWGEFDLMGLMQQIGAVPSPAE